jgi:hypothetical protein
MEKKGRDFLQKILTQSEDDLKEDGFTEDTESSEKPCDSCGQIHDQSYDEIIKSANSILPHVEKALTKFIKDNGKLSASDLSAIFFFIASKFILQLKTDDLSPDDLIDYKQNALMLLGRGIVALSNDFPKGVPNIMERSPHVH